MCIITAIQIINENTVFIFNFPESCKRPRWYTMWHVNKNPSKKWDLLSFYTHTYWSLYFSIRHTPANSPGRWIYYIVQSSCVYSSEPCVTLWVDDAFVNVMRAVKREKRWDEEEEGDGEETKNNRSVKSDALSFMLATLSARVLVKRVWKIKRAR